MERQQIWPVAAPGIWPPVRETEPLVRETEPPVPIRTITVGDVTEAFRETPAPAVDHTWWHHSINSWGSGWGSGGFGLVPDDMVDALHQREVSRVVAYGSLSLFPSPPQEADRNCGHVDLSTGLAYYWSGASWVRDERTLDAGPALASVLRRSNVNPAPDVPVEPIKTKRQVRF